MAPTQDFRPVLLLQAWCHVCVKDWVTLSRILLCEVLRRSTFVQHDMSQGYDVIAILARATVVGCSSVVAIHVETANILNRRLDMWHRAVDLRLVVFCSDD